MFGFNVAVNGWNRSIGQQIFLKSLLENEDMGLIEGAPDSVSIWSKAIGITR